VRKKTKCELLVLLNRAYVNCVVDQAPELACVGCTPCACVLSY